MLLHDGTDGFSFSSVFAVSLQMKLTLTLSFSDPQGVVWRVVGRSSFIG